MSAIRVVSLAALATLCIHTGMAQESDEQTSEESVLQEMGEVISQDDLLKRVHAKYRGKVVESELRRDGRTHTYFIQFLDESGVRRELKFNATTGEEIPTSGR